MDQPERHLLLLSKITLEFIKCYNDVEYISTSTKYLWSFWNLLKLVFEAFARLELNPIFWDGNYLLAERPLCSTCIYIMY